MFHIIYIFQIMDHNYFSPELPTSPTRAPVDMHEPLSSPPVPTTPVPVLYPESESLFSTPVRKPTIPLPFFNKSFSSTSPDHSTPAAQPPILSPPSDDFLNSTPNSTPTNPSPRSRSSSPVADSGPSPVADSGPSPVADSGQPAVLTCKVCLQAFKHSQSARRHEREKHGEKRQELEDGVMLVPPKRQVQCFVCEQVITGASRDLVRHQQSRSCKPPGQAPLKVSCPICNSAMNKKSMKKHFERFHPNNGIIN